jgi:transcriptional regulator with XRE-family HTH domain
MYDYSKLLGRMREKNMTQEALADSIGVSAFTLNGKLNNKTDFKQSEILKIAKELGISDKLIVEYFFAH